MSDSPDSSCSGYDELHKECLDALTTRYKLLRKIGVGGFGDVWHAVHIVSGLDVAIKIIPREKIDEIGGLKEARVLLQLNHRHICKLYQVVETAAFYMMVVEYCSQGELFELVITERRVREDRARIILRQIVSALMYMNNKSFSHRDLKLENILLDANGDVKLIDFGLCGKKNPRKPYFETFCGTAAFAAPEILDHIPYKGTSADIFSLGVCLYILLCGRLPFNEPGEKDNMVDYFRYQWKHLANPLPFKSHLRLSVEVKELLQQMLAVNPERRISLVAVASHRWLRGGGLGVVDWRGEPEVCLSLVGDTGGQCIRMDLDILKAMCTQFCTSCDKLLVAFRREPAGYLAASYKLLVERRRLLNDSPAARCNTPNVTETYQKLMARHKEKMNNSPCIHESFTDIRKLDVSLTDIMCAEDEATRTPLVPCRPPLDDNTAVAKTVPVNRKRQLTPAPAFHNTTRRAIETPKTCKRSRANPATYVISCGGRNQRYCSLEDLHGDDGLVTPLSSRVKMRPYEKIVNIFGSVRKGMRSVRKTMRRVAAASGAGRVKDVNVVQVPGYADDAALVSAILAILRDSLDMSCSSRCSQSGGKSVVEAAMYRVRAADASPVCLVGVHLEVVYIDSLQCLGLRRKRLRGDTLLYSQLMRELLVRLGVLQPQPQPQQPIHCDLFDTLV